MVFLFSDELIEVTSIAELHDDVELLSFDDGLTIRDDVDMFELFEKFDLIEDVFSLLLCFVGEFYFFYDVVLVLGDVFCKVCVAEGAV